MKMNSSQESDISVESFETAGAGSQTTQSTLSSQDEIDVELNDGWRNDPIDVEVHDFDESNSGPTHRLADDASPLDFFKLFWTEHLTDVIITETNRYVNS